MGSVRRTTVHGQRHTAHSLGAFRRITPKNAGAREEGTPAIGAPGIWCARFGPPHTLGAHAHFLAKFGAHAGTLEHLADTNRHQIILQNHSRAELPLTLTRAGPLQNVDSLPIVFSLTDPLVEVVVSELPQAALKACAVSREDGRPTRRFAGMPAPQLKARVTTGHTVGRRAALRRVRGGASPAAFE
jgi:hypothetical protein